MVKSKPHHGVLKSQKPYRHSLALKGLRLLPSVTLKNLAVQDA